MDKLQGKLVKSALGISKYGRNTSLLNALKINKLTKLRDIHSIDLFKSIMFSRSRATRFYNHILNTKEYTGKFNNLVTRISPVCQNMELSMIKYVFNDDYESIMPKAVAER